MKATLLCLLVIATIAVGQERDTTMGGRSISQEEILLDGIETEADDSELLDRLEWLEEHPFDLNSVTEIELRSIPTITPAEAARVAAFRDSVQYITSVHQLSSVGGVGDDLYSKLQAFVYVNSSASHRGVGARFAAIRSRGIKDLQQRAGFLDNSFAGSPLKSYNRVTVNLSTHLAAGALFEKDAGERFGAGFSSGYIAANDVSFVRRIVAGDFVVDAGQGLVFWRGTAFGKGGEAVSTAMKSGLGPQPYHSSDEFNFLRGAAATIPFFTGAGRVEMTGVYSDHALDATVDDVGNVTGFYTAGLFRTPSEEGKQGSVHERLLGGRLQYVRDGLWNVGISYARARFDKPVIANRTFEFAGTSSNVAGIDFEARFGVLGPQLFDLTLFGEIAQSRRNAAAGVVGTVLNISPTTSLAAVYRNYSPEFNNLHARGFGDGDNTKNERGLYFGFQSRLSHALKMSGYLDQFSHPWRTFSNPLPTRGYEIFIQPELRASSQLTLYLRFVGKSAETTEATLDSFSRNERLVVDRNQQKLRLTAVYDAGRHIRIKGRVEMTDVAYGIIKKRERGYLFYQDLRYRTDAGFNLELRLVFFDTESFDSRLYEYENDLRGVFANPALFGKGRRWYVLVGYTMFGSVRFSAKYAETQKDGVTSISSGDAEIRGDIDNRFALQIDLAL